MIVSALSRIVRRRVILALRRSLASPPGYWDQAAMSRAQRALDDLLLRDVEAQK